MNPNESVIKQMHPHPFKYLGFYIGGIIFILVGLVLHWLLIIFGILVFFLGEAARRAETFSILDSGVERDYKLLSSTREFTAYNKIQDLKVNQSFIDSIFGIGNVHIDTAGEENSELNFDGVKDPYDIENIIRERMKNS